MDRLEKLVKQALMGKGPQSSFRNRVAHIGDLAVGIPDDSIPSTRRSLAHLSAKLALFFESKVDQDAYISIARLALEPLHHRKAREQLIDLHPSAAGERPFSRQMRKRFAVAWICYARALKAIQEQKIDRAEKCVVIAFRILDTADDSFDVEQKAWARQASSRGGRAKPFGDIRVQKMFAKRLLKCRPAEGWKHIDKVALDTSDLLREIVDHNRSELGKQWRKADFSLVIRAWIEAEEGPVYDAYMGKATC